MRSFWLILFAIFSLIALIGILFGAHIFRWELVIWIFNANVFAALYWRKKHNV